MAVDRGQHFVDGIVATARVIALSRLRQQVEAGGGNWEALVAVAKTEPYQAGNIWHLTISPYLQGGHPTSPVSQRICAAYVLACPVPE